MQFFFSILLMVLPLTAHFIGRCQIVTEKYLHYGPRQTSCNIYEYLKQTLTFFDSISFLRKLITLILSEKMSKCQLDVCQGFSDLIVILTSL
jgi:hypothetical protein